MPVSDYLGAAPHSPPAMGTWPNMGIMMVIVILGMVVGTINLMISMTVMVNVLTMTKQIMRMQQR